MVKVGLFSGGGIASAHIRGYTTHAERIADCESGRTRTIAPVLRAPRSESPPAMTRSTADKVIA